MSVERIKNAIEKLDRGMRIIETRAESGAFDRMQDRHERQRQREKDLRDRARAELEARQQNAEQLEALNKRYEELVASHDQTVDQLRRELQEQNERSELLTQQLRDTQASPNEAPESERFRHLKLTHKALKRKHDILSNSATEAVIRMGEIIDALGKDGTDGGASDG